VPTDYDEIGEGYLLTKELAWKRFSERADFFAALGEVRGLRVLDVACGEGFYSRRLRDAGAEVVGVDRSREMIRLARVAEERRRRGIRYEELDATDLPRLRERGVALGFDAVVAQWLFDYADTRGALRAMCRSIAEVVRSGGRFVHVGGCFASLLEHPERFRRFGVELEVLDSCGDGSRIRWTVRSDGRSVSAENTMWTPATITAELEDAGFTGVRWPAALVGAEGMAEMDAAYWSDYLAHPYHAVTCATRGGGAA